MKLKDKKDIDINVCDIYNMRRPPTNYLRNKTIQQRCKQKVPICRK